MREREREGGTITPTEEVVCGALTGEDVCKAILDSVVLSLGHLV